MKNNKVAASFGTEDHLKQLIRKTGGGEARLRNPNAPRVMHSCFGDFPRDKNTQAKFDPQPLTVEPLKDLMAAQQSTAKPTGSKYSNNHLPSSYKSL